jgi:Transglutaminase-like superfamily
LPDERSILNESVTPGLRKQPFACPRRTQTIDREVAEMPRKPVQHDRRRALYASTAWLVGPLLPMSSALARALIDGTDPAIEALSASLIEGRETPRERAVAIHDHVRDEVRFGFTPQMYAMSAPDVLRAGLGYSQSKSTLFVALLRAAGIEARLQFVDLDARILRGLLDLRSPFIDHCYAEVLLGGAWVPTDSYVVDSALFRAATAALRAESRSLGYAVRVDGRPQWDGRAPAHVQFVPDDDSSCHHRWGVFSDVTAFYEHTPDAWNRLNNVTRVVLPLAAHAANVTTEALRRDGPSAVRGRERRLQA